MKRIFLPFLFIILIMITGCSEKTADGIKMPFSSGVCKGDNYQDVISDLKNAGFTNVETEVLYDLVTGILTKDGEVEKVSVNGDAKYDPDARYPKDVKIVVTYHTFKESQTNKNKENSNISSDIKPPYDNNSSKGLNYLDVVEAFKNAGFKNISVEKRYEASFSGCEADTVANIYINNSGAFSTDSYYNSDAKIRIDYYVISESDAKSDTELTRSYAQIAFENYGKKIYPYGFKCHWIMDLRNAEQYDDGSWFLKVGVTIENQYGNKIDTVAEAKISGTDKNPKVDQFYVSNTN